MAPYYYRELATEKHEIRLLRLLPGKSNEPLRGEIFHAPLLPPSKAEDKRLPLEVLARSLPSEWDVQITNITGRYIFSKTRLKDEVPVTSWKHPVAGYPREHYEGCSDEFTDYEPKYEAISYVWGDSDSQDVLTVEPGSTSFAVTSTLHLRDNLATALRQVRRPSVSRVLWIDAICTNQADLAERQEQVLRMANIFRWASRVVFWLGTSTPTSADALNSMVHLGGQVEFTTESRLLPSPAVEQPSWVLGGTGPKFSGATWDALERFLQRPWFERVWIIQEVGFCNRHSIIQCGNDTALWSLFADGITTLYYKTVILTSSKAFEQAFYRAANLAFVRGRTYMPHGLYIHSHPAKCSDPRDKVYGILGFAPPSFASLIRRDYLLPPAEIYMDAFIAALHVSKRAEMLRFCSSRTRTTSGLPTWAPDWSSKPDNASFPLQCFASGFSSTHWQRVAPEVLQMKGVRAGTVSSVHEMFTGDIEQLLSIFGCLRSSLQTGEAYVNGEPALEALVATLICNRRREAHSTEAGSAEFFPILAEWVGYLDGSLAEGGEFWLSRLSLWIRDLCFVETVEGYMGLGTTATKPGDIIAVLLGCDCPMALRRLDDSDHYEVVDECFVYGLMFAESLLGRMPPTHSVLSARDSRKPGTYTFVNQTSGTLSTNLLDDPRLGPMPGEWEIIPPLDKHDMGDLQPLLRHRETKEEINSDPRLLPASLKARGVALESFRLC